MKKLLLLTISALLMSCSGDEPKWNNETNDLIGKWAYNSTSYDVQTNNQDVTNAIISEHSDYGTDATPRIYFSEWGKFGNVFLDGSILEQCDYRVSNKIITFSYNDLSKSYQYYVDGDAATFVLDYTGNYKKLYPDNDVLMVKILLKYIKLQ